MKGRALRRSTGVWRVAGLVGITILAFSTGRAHAQISTTFTVTVEVKNSAHPSFGRGWDEGFVIDGEQGKSVAAIRGRTYTFQMSNVDAIHPFYISTSDAGVGAGVYNDGVSGNFASGNSALTFSPDESSPDLLYYQCGAHDFMGWRIYVMDEAEVGLQLLAQSLTSPVTFAQPDDGSGRLFVVDQAGDIRIITADGAMLDEPFLSVRSRMVTLSENFDERGLLGLAFHPNFATNGRFFVYYSAPLRETAPSDWNHTATISEFAVSSGDPNVADPESERIVLEVDEPQGNHNGGTLTFGPDGFLYISLGDGGAANDVALGHVSDWYDANEGGNAQNVEANLLGKILRIDVDGDEPYDIPADNPFVGTDGLDEIFAYGLRNPYRISFDMGGEHGLLVGDAGQNRWEEVSQVSLGDNLGWNVREGTHCFDAANPDEDAPSCPTEVGSGHPDSGAPLIDPVIEYKNFNQEGGVGLVVVGGYVYRGSAIPELVGRYIFGDWSTDFSEPGGILMAAMPADEGRWPVQLLRVAEREETTLDHFILGFGQDLDGEMYLLTTNMGGPTGLTGRVYKLINPENVATEGPSELPDRMVLRQNYPNPFNPSTSIRFSIPKTAHATLTIYDVLGRRVVTLFDGVLSSGSHDVAWNGQDEAGLPVPSATYIFQLKSGGETQSRAMILLK